MTTLLTDKSLTQKEYLTKVKLAYDKLCPNNLLSDEQTKFINGFSIDALTSYEIIKEKYDYMMQLNGISSKVEKALKDYTNKPTDFTCKDDNGKLHQLCLQKISNSEINALIPQTCTTGGKKRRNKSRKTGKKHARRQNKRRSYKRNTKIW